MIMGNIATRIHVKMEQSARKDRNDRSANASDTLEHSVLRTSMNVPIQIRVPMVDPVSTQMDILDVNALEIGLDRTVRPNLDRR